VEWGILSRERGGDLGSRYFLPFSSPRGVIDLGFDKSCQQNPIGVDIFNIQVLKKVFDLSGYRWPPTSSSWLTYNFHLDSFF
jgi:hypothetical protein